ncbi:MULTISPECIES: DUF2179 domain-containing protein [Anaerolinea]|uniref:DUF2179 domain-containing protein n=1 Tax=Anaerolinea TaxID=233189 RepID=UPI00261C4B71|nr:DUF5698 domain-containing protein [Anaerolinea thermophila]
MQSFLTPEIFLTALIIFVMRVVDMSMDTIRILFVVRGKKLFSWILGFLQSLVFIIAVSRVLSGDVHPLSVLAYATGFATGNIVGMIIEDKMAIGHVRITIISTAAGSQIAQALRDAGFAVTEIPAFGKNGAVTMLNCSVLRRDFDHAEDIIRKADPEAFITAEEVRAIHRGFWRS